MPRAVGELSMERVPRPQVVTHETRKGLLLATLFREIVRFFSVYSG